MKKYLMWSFERGSRPYDVICLVILAFIFITPPGLFNDRPKLTGTISDQAIRQTNDADGHKMYVVNGKTEQDAVDRLKASLGSAVVVARTEAVYDDDGQPIAYSIWIQR